MEATSTSLAQQNKRFSRYRSVRKAATNETDHPPVPNLPEGPQAFVNAQGQPPITITPSRYHRKVVTPKTEAIASLPSGQGETYPGAPPVRPTNRWPVPIPEGRVAQETSPARPSYPENNSHLPQTQCTPHGHGQSHAPSSAVQQRKTRYRSRTAATPKEQASSPTRSYDVAREEARVILDGEHDRLAKLKQQQEVLQREQKERADRRAIALRNEQADANSSAESEPSKSFTSRARKWTIGGSSQGSPPVTAPSSPPSAQVPQSIPSSLSRKVSQIIRRPKLEESVEELPPLPVSLLTETMDQSTQKKRERRPTATKPRNYEPKAGDGPPKTAIAAPQTVDAPMSAVNAGDRRVEVRFEKSKITLPVTPSTTVRELLNSASIILSQPIDPRTAVLLETYYPLGLERPLRRYERVRDVMNSWDSDTQNYLMILPESECNARGLEQKDAPKVQPPQIMLNFQHSQKPGKWENHWVTLKDDGQVTVSRQENDINAANLFHLSDFDVYMPTRKEVKKVKPPKKICFAIKSQQRSIVFESTKNFVHYFSTSDRHMADAWYNAVQDWRSWYLVNILDQGGAAKAPITSAAPMGVLPSHERPSTASSRDSVPYQLGTFQPLLEFSVDAFRYGEEEEKKMKRRSRNGNISSNSNIPLDQSLKRTNAEPETSLNQRSNTTRRTKPSGTRPSKPVTEVAHTETKEVRAAPLLHITEAGFTGKGLLARAFSVKKAQAEENATMYDNTDNAFTGKGLLARQMSTRKFVSDNTVVAENTDEAFTGSGLLARKMSTKKFVNENMVPENTNDAFTGKGLVARSVTRKKSRVAARPGQPLVDLAVTSEFMDKSLLRSVEAHEIMQGQYLPVIDRSRGVEVNMKTGEI